MTGKEKDPVTDDAGLYAPPDRYERDLDRDSDGEENRRPPVASDHYHGSAEPPAGAAGAPPQSSAPSGEDKGPAGPGESREETIQRVEHEQEEVYRTTGSSMNRDVTSRRRLGTRAIVTGVIMAIVGAAIGLVIGLVAWNPAIPASLAVVGFVLGALLTAENDDGAIAERASARQAHRDAQSR